MSDPKTSPDWAGVQASEIYRFFGAYYIYQDQLSWSRTQTMAAIEGAVLAVAATKGGTLGGCALLIGAVVVCLFWQLIERDWEIRDQNGAVLDNVHGPIRLQLVPPSSRTWCRWGADGEVALRILVFLVVVVDVVWASLLFAH